MIFGVYFSTYSVSGRGDQVLDPVHVCESVYSGFDAMETPVPSHPVV